jgi:hypothetical protein
LALGAVENLTAKAEEDPATGRIVSPEPFKKMPPSIGFSNRMIYPVFRTALTAHKRPQSRKIM